MLDGYWIYLNHFFPQFPICDYDLESYMNNIWKWCDVNTVLLCAEFSVPQKGFYLRSSRYWLQKCLTQSSECVWMHTWVCTLSHEPQNLDFCSSNRQTQELETVFTSFLLWQTIQVRMGHFVNTRLIKRRLLQGALYKNCSQMVASFYFRFTSQPLRISGLHTCCTTIYSLKLDWIKYHWQQRIGAIRWRLLSATASVMKSLISWYRTGQHFIEELQPFSISSCFHVLSGCKDCSVLRGPLLACSEGWCPWTKKTKSIEHNQANAEIITTKVYLILWRS